MGVQSCFLLPVIIKFFKIQLWKVASNPASSSLLLIEDLGKDETHSDATLDDCMEFVHHYVYNSKPNEDLVAVKVPLYNI